MRPTKSRPELRSLMHYPADERSAVKVNSRTMLIAAGATLALGEAIDAFMIDVPAAAAVMALLFASLAAWFYRRESVAAAGILAFLFFLEVILVPAYDRSDLTDWVVQLSLGLASLVGLIAAIATVRTMRRHRDPHTISRSPSPL